MKKLKYVVFIFIALLVVTGCGNSSKKKSVSASDELKEAMLKFKDVKAISLKVDMNLNMEQMQLPMNMDLSIKNGSFHMKYGMNILGMQYFQEMYTLEKDDEEYIYSYDSDEGTWKYTKGESVFDFSLTDIRDEEMSYEEFLDEYLPSMLDVKEVKTDKEGYQKLEVTISRENLKNMVKDKLTKEEFSNFDMTEIESFPEKFVYDVYLKNGEISILYFDLSNINLDDSTSSIGALSAFDITMEITGTNDDVEEIVLPKEAENATYINPGNMDFFGSDDDIDDDNLDGKQDV